MVVWGGAVLAGGGTGGEAGGEGGREGGRREGQEEKHQLQSCSQFDH